MRRALRNLVRTIISFGAAFVVGFVTRTWVIAIVTVVICAGFLADAASSLIEAEALADAPTSTVPVIAKPTIITAATKLDGTKINRNIFCSDCEPAAVASGGAPARYAGEPAVLIATMLGPDPRATVRVLASEAQGSWGVGERIPGVGMIDRIGSTSIDVVDVSGHKGTISMLDAIAVEGAPKRSADAATSRGPAAATDPFADRVRKISDTEYEVDRQLVRDLVTGTTKAGGVRPIPMMKGNEVQGIRMVGVRPGSVAAALGIKANDVIAAVDGDQIKNVQQLLELYAKLDQVNAVELTGTRAGKPLALTLRLR
jgi:membrane-associated protease RseP (regulator of RpoE activity)